MNDCLIAYRKKYKYPKDYPSQIHRTDIMDYSIWERNWDKIKLILPLEEEVSTLQKELRLLIKQKSFILKTNEKEIIDEKQLEINAKHLKIDEIEENIRIKYNELD